MDVLTEVSRIERNGGSDTRDNIHISNFTKEYLTTQGCCPKNYRAVNNLSFGLKTGESFALLGVNGAGKSTTFKALTNSVIPTSGEIWIGKYNLHKNFNEARKLIGYCP